MMQQPPSVYTEIQTSRKNAYGLQQLQKSNTKSIYSPKLSFNVSDWELPLSGDQILDNFILLLFFVYFFFS